jgi:hypothetical protein
VGIAPEQPSVPLDPFFAKQVPSVKRLKLHTQQRGSKIVEAEIESGNSDIVRKRVSAKAVPGQGIHSVRPEKPEVSRMFIVICDDHPSFGAREILVAEKAEAPDVPHMPQAAVPSHARGMAASSTIHCFPFCAGR